MQVFLSLGSSADCLYSNEGFEVVVVVVVHLLEAAPRLTSGAQETFEILIAPGRSCSLLSVVQLALLQVASATSAAEPSSQNGPTPQGKLEIPYKRAGRRTAPILLERRTRRGGRWLGWDRIGRTRLSKEAVADSLVPSRVSFHLRVFLLSSTIFIGRQQQSSRPNAARHQASSECRDVVSIMPTSAVCSLHISRFVFTKPCQAYELRSDGPGG